MKESGSSPQTTRNFAWHLMAFLPHFPAGLEISAMTKKNDQAGMAISAGAPWRNQLIGKPVRLPKKRGLSTAIVTLSSNTTSKELARASYN
jgi:hypothetical protein